MATSTSEFKDACRAYAALGDQMAEIAAKMRDVKAAKDALGEQILAWMSSTGVSEVQLQDGSRIGLRTSRRTSTLSKDFLVEKLAVSMSGDTAAAQRIIDTIYQERTVEEKSVISRIKPRGGGAAIAAAAAAADDD